MTPRERFVHFVCVFSYYFLAGATRDKVIEEAVTLNPHILEDEHENLGPPAIERPMDSAWEFVQYRRYGAPRPYWYPAVEKPDAKLFL